MLKSKLPPRSGFVALRQLNPEDAIKGVFFVVVFVLLWFFFSYLARCPFAT